MNTAKYVDEQIALWKAEGKSKQEIVWDAALLCVGWPYVFGAWGAECTPAERRKRYSDEHPTIKTKCQVLNGSRSSCTGCQWYPDGERVRCFDCRGFIDWTLRQVGIDLIGEGCTSQWNTKANWADKGEIGTVPENTLVCLFVKKGSKMEHTGFGLQGQTVECSSGVQHFEKRKAKWTHWAIPAGIEGGPEPEPQPVPPEEVHPTLRRGSKGDAVREAQTILQKLGYDLGSCGIDGDFGTSTEKAVKEFQRDHGLTVDGICGPATWAALDAAQPGPETKPEPAEDRYTVTIPGLSLQQAEKICKEWSVASMKKE